MGFSELRFDLPRVNQRVINTLGLVNQILGAPNRVLPIDIVTLDAQTGHGMLGRQLRQVLVKVKGPSRSKGVNTPALYQVNKPAVMELRRAAEQFIQRHGGPVDNPAQCDDELEPNRMAQQAA